MVDSRSSCYTGGRFRSATLPVNRSCRKRPDVERMSSWGRCDEMGMVVQMLLHVTVHHPDTDITRMGAACTVCSDIHEVSGRYGSAWQCFLSIPISLPAPPTVTVLLLHTMLNALLPARAGWVMEKLYYVLQYTVTTCLPLVCSTGHRLDNRCAGAGWGGGIPHDTH